MSDDPVVLVEADPTWPAQFAREQALLQPVFEGARLEHIGSTAVSGLVAKPIIDTLVGASQLRVFERAVPALRALGYEYVPEFENELPERRFFQKFTDGVRSHHLHGAVLSSPFWCEQIAFRDRLRRHPDLVADYAALKRELAARHRNDRAAYTRGKSEFIERVIAGAAIG